MSEIIYLTGPVRSGKSRRAVNLARAWGDAVVFVATYRITAGDEEMCERVRLHQTERPAWRILEAPRDVAGELAALTPPPSGVVLDSLGLWASDRFERSDSEIRAIWDDQLTRFAQAPWPIVVVNDEVGWSPVPANVDLRRFRDLVGFLGQQTAQAAMEAWLMVAGCPLKLK